jgi:hypothetical protein
MLDFIQATQYFRMGDPWWFGTVCFTAKLR